MKKFLAIVLAIFLSCPGCLSAFSGANAESAHNAAEAFDELPEDAFRLRKRGNGTAEIAGVELGEARNVAIPSEIEGQKIIAIGDSAIREKENLITLVIPDTVTSIGEFSFYKCENLKSVTFSDSLESIGYGAFSSCGGLRKVNLPESLVSLGDFVFMNCSELDTIILPDSLTAIGDGTFNNCFRLTDVVISPDHPAYAYGNHALIDKRDRTLIQYIGPDTETYEVPQGILKIGDDAFTYHYFKSIVIPQGVTSIGDRAFALMSHLEEVILPDSVTSIGYKAFYSTKSLKSIRIPAGVTEIGGNNFSWCNLVKIEVDPANPVFEMQGNMLINKAEHKLVFHLDLDRDTAEVPEGIEIIGAGAFENSNQVETVILPDTVKEIGQDAFASCNDLTDLRLPTGLKTIERGLIRNCRSIRSLTLPEGVETIKSLAIQECENLEEIIIPASVKEIGINALTGCPRLTCKVTEGSTAQRFCEEYKIPYVIQ